MAKKEESKEQLSPLEQKMKALQAAMSKIEKDFGKGSIMRMGEEKIDNVEVIPTGSIGLNAALGVGGYPKGFYAEKLGADIANLYISQPDNGEQALEIADQLIRSAAIDIIVIDSVAALTPKKEIEGDMGDSAVGLHARLMSQALRKLTSTIANRKVNTIKDGDNVVGNQVRVKVVKNKVAPPFRKAEFEITFGEGISKVGEIVDLATEHEIIKKSGSWFSYGDSKLGQGRDAVKALLMDNPELCEELEAKIMEAISNKQ